MKKIISKIILFFKYLILALISPFRKSETEKEKKENAIKNTNIDKSSNKEVKPSGDLPTSLPDTANVNANPHDTTSDEETPNSINLTPPPKIIKLKKIYQEDSKKIIFTKELIEELIDEELEETYKDLDFKVKEATKEQEEDIKELKEKIVPKIEEKIEKNNLTTIEEVKEEIKDIVKEEMELKPLFPPIEITFTEKPKKTEEKKEPYTLATKVNKTLNLAPEKPNKVHKEEKIATVPNQPKIKEKIAKTPEMMVPLVEDIPKPTIKEDIKEIITGTVLTTASVAKEIVTPKIERKKEALTIPEVELPKLKAEFKELKKDNKPPLEQQPEQPKETTILEEPKVEMPSIAKPFQQEDPNKETPLINSEEPAKGISPIDLEETIAEIQTPQLEEPEEIVIEEIELPTIEEHKNTIEDISPEEVIILEEIHQKIDEKETKEEKIEVKKELEDKVETIKEEKVIENKDIDELTETSEETMEEVKKESKKEDFFEKDYDHMEAQINNMLDDIANTLLKYDGKLSERQKNKLKKEEEKLRKAKANLLEQKDRDISYEKSQLDAEIHQSEIDGLQEELKKMHFEYQAEADERLLKKMERLEGMTREQVANADKRIMMKRFNKASLLLEMTSLLSFPFIRNKYFLYFTIGLIIDNHFNFINAFWKRKVNKYQPADLSNIRRGIDALDGAIDLTYKNTVQLDYLEQEALSRYPELQYDQAFINKVTSIRIKLDKNYNKLMKKKQTMEKYMGKTKKQIKILKRDEK